mmetsp:Transcript_24048/g.38670  ORF Transcript_24048/g.38670 Transcript_24048/m.38670 type:complete len:207 (+) Transcript_24048:801-1421(+)
MSIQLTADFLQSCMQFLVLVVLLVLDVLNAFERILRLRFVSLINLKLNASFLAIECLKLGELFLFLFQLVEALLKIVDNELHFVSLVVGVVNEFLRLGTILLVHASARNLFNQLQALVVALFDALRNLSLWHDEILVVLADTGRLEQVVELLLGRLLLVDKVVVLLGANRTLNRHQRLCNRKSTTLIVKYHLHVRRDHTTLSSVVQ